MTKAHPGSNMRAPVLSQWLSTMSAMQELTIQEPKSEFIPAPINLPCFGTLAGKLMTQGVFPVDKPLTPEEKAAKKAAKIAKIKEEHPDWIEYEPPVSGHGCFGYLNGDL